MNSASAYPDGVDGGDALVGMIHRRNLLLPLWNLNLNMKLKLKLNLNFSFQQVLGLFQGY